MVAGCSEGTPFPKLRLLLRFNKKSIGNENLIKNYQDKPCMPTLQCEPFLFIFAYDNKSRYRYDSLRTHGAQNVCLHLQCRYRPSNQGNHRRRRDHNGRFAVAIGRSELLRLLWGACRFVSDGAQCATDGYGGYQCSSVKRFWKCRLNCSDGIFAVFGRT